MVVEEPSGGNGTKVAVAVHEQILKVLKEGQKETNDNMNLVIQTQKNCQLSCVAALARHDERLNVLENKNTKAWDVLKIGLGAVSGAMAGFITMLIRGGI